jgi:hypothetical protein
MKNLKRLGISVTLLCTLSMTAFAGDTNSPPCAPGDTNSPPCASAQVTADDSVIPGDIMTPPALSSETEYSIAEATVDLLMNVLFLF